MRTGAWGIGSAVATHQDGSTRTRPLARVGPLCYTSSPAETFSRLPGIDRGASGRARQTRMGVRNVLGNLSDSWRGRERYGKRLPVLLGAFGLVAIATIAYWMTAGRGNRRADVESTAYLYQCTVCDETVEWTGRQVMEGRAASKDGGLPCPACGGPLAQAERIEGGEIRPHASPVGGADATPEMAQPAKGKKKTRGKK